MLVGIILIVVMVGTGIGLSIVIGRRATRLAAQPPSSTSEKLGMNWLRGGQILTFVIPAVIFRYANDHPDMPQWLISIALVGMLFGLLTILYACIQLLRRAR